MTDPGGEQQGNDRQNQNDHQAGQDQGQQQGQNQGEGSGQDSGQQDGKLYTQDYVGTLRNEAANYRTQRNQYRDSLRAMGMLDDDGNVRDAQNRAQQRQDDQQQGPDPRDERIQTLEGRIRQGNLERTAERLAMRDGKPERASYIAQLATANLDVRFDDHDRPDEVQVQEAITRVLNDVPELRVVGQNLGGDGSNPGGSDRNDTEKNPWSQEHHNLTEQGRIVREDPAKAERLQKAAQG